MKLLDAVADFNAIYTKDAQTIYNSKQYYVRRIKRLMDEGYLVRKNKMITLAGKGKRYFELECNRPIRTSTLKNEEKKRYSEMYRLKLSMNNFRFIPSFSIERHTKNYAYKYYGKAISQDGTEYWVYRIANSKVKDTDAEDVKKKKLKGKSIEITKLKNEILEIQQYLTMGDSVPLIKTIIFIEDKHTMKSYREVAGHLDISEHIVIPYTSSGMSLLNRFVGMCEGKNEMVLQALRSQGVNAVLGHPQWILADFNINGMYGINLTMSDLNKEMNLKAYLSLTNRPEMVVIVCASSQRKKYAKEYPGCQIIVLK